jgi:sterol desaturase/sphingolipid hydroxylase (fatty acid hydroxylase superfamily)
MALKPGFGYKFPWEDMGTFKYLLFVPFVATVALGRDDADDWCWHMLAIAAVRYVHSQFWISLSRVHAVTQHTKIQAKGIDYKQIDREDHWDDYIILQLIVMTLVHKCPGLGFSGFPKTCGAGLAQLLLLHAGPTEFAYYWLHRLLHHHTLYSAYHSHHHASFVTEPITGSVHPFMEHLMYTANFAIPLLGTWAMGGASIAMFYAYLIGFDVLNNIGHCNFEFIPRWFMNLPLMKYLIYTPSYHSLHHSKVHTNFCLFMPLYDYAYGTADPGSHQLYERAMKGEAAPNKAPDVVFVAHGTELLSLFHLPFALRSFSSRPFKSAWWLQPFLPLCLPVVALLRLFGQPFVSDKHRLKHLNCATWVTPAWGFQFFIKREFSHINRKIEKAILQANESGVKVLGLGALNKNEALNGGGQLFVDKHPNLNVRVVHGNTLTAAAILQKIPDDVREIFLTGATSKLGRAIALYLSAKGVRVVMYTTSKERFEKIRGEARRQDQKNIVQATTLEEGRGIKDWVVGKHCSPKDQEKAPKHATFHQFVVPPIPETRRDCVYTNLPAFALPKEAKDFRSCEMTMERGHVHACHAGALVHALEGWTYNEVGAIDHTRIDSTWEAAMKHGFKLATVQAKAIS